jgi:hypothetical protein
LNADVIFNSFLVPFSRYFLIKKSLTDYFVIWL